MITAASLLALTACVEKVEQVAPPVDTAADGGGGENADLTADVRGGDLEDGPLVVERFGGDELSFGTVPSEPEQASGEPIRIGMINQEDTPLGSFPELRLASQAGVDMINEELGGVGGRPIELVPCITTFSPEKSQACAQELSQGDVVAVLGGIDLASTGSIPVLEQNGMPYVGGIAINADEMVSPVSFQFSGGTPGAFIAFADHAADEGAEKVVVAYGDYGPIKSAAVDYGAAVLEARGVEVVEIPFPVTATDFLPVLSAAAAAEPDAIMLAAADTACAPAMQTAHDLEIEADLYLVGACAAPTIADEVGVDAVDGIVFNIEGPIDPDDIEGQVYLAAVGLYGDPALTAVGAGTVTFRSLMNLYAVLEEIGPEDVSRETIIEAFRSAKDQPSFNGHDYTCDGQQIPALPAICAPQQILTVNDMGTLEPLTDWVDVPAIIREAGVGQDAPGV